MATTYLAPGVYVEEIPSARQPIAGVGTNTAGFIGLVPDTIYCPVINNDYDPVAAEKAMSTQPPAAVAPAQNVQALRDGLKAAQDKQRTAKAAMDQAKKDLDKAGGDAEKRAAQGVLDKATEDSANADQAVRDAQAKLAAAPAAPGGGAAGPLTDAQRRDAMEALLTASNTRPYFLKKVLINVDVADTKFCTNFKEYTDRFGDYSAYNDIPENPGDPPDKWRFAPYDWGHNALTNAVAGFFQNGGAQCFVARIKQPSELRKVLEAFESIDELALIAAPGCDPSADTWDALITHASNRENCFAILDCPVVVGKNPDDLDIQRLKYDNAPNADLPSVSKDAAYYFPQIEVVDPAKQLQDADVKRQVGTKYRGRTYVPPSGHMAGIYARTDEERGVHKAPANAVVRGALDLRYYVSKATQGSLNPQGVNCIRNMNGTIAVWGARTIGGDRNGEWKYISVRRLFLFLRKSIDEGTQWVVFEPNDRALWGKIILNVSAFLTNVWRSGALFGATPQEAFYVKCDDELNPPEVRDVGQVITEIGVAIVRPAEFVIFRITQATAQQTS